MAEAGDLFGIERGALIFVSWLKVSRIASEQRPWHLRLTRDNVDLTSARKKSDKGGDARRTPDHGGRRTHQQIELRQGA